MKKAKDMDVLILIYLSCSVQHDSHLKHTAIEYLKYEQFKLKYTLNIKDLEKKSKMYYYFLNVLQGEMIFF